MLVKLCKISLIAIIALFFTLAAFSNITDYDTNHEFVKHVLSMDTVFSTSTTTWRAITSEPIQTLMYWAIIFWETITALICWLACFKLICALHNSSTFIKYKQIAVLGLTSGFALYSLVFMTIGAEWFQMWQSQTWNGQPAAAQFLTMIGIVILIFLAPDE